MREKFIQGYDEDKHFDKVRTMLSQNEEREALQSSKKNRLIRTPFYREDGLIYRRDIDNRAFLCVPQNCLKDVFEMAHDAQFHAGQRKIIAALDGLSIPRLAKRIKQYINHCPECLKNRTDTQKPMGELQPIQSKSRPYHTVAMDFIMGLPKEQSRSFWTVQDCQHPFNTLLTVTCK